MAYGKTTDVEGVRRGLFFGRALLRNSYYALNAAYELGADIEWPKQYERAKL